MKLTHTAKIITGVYVLTGILWLLFIVLTRHTPTYEGFIYEFILRPFLIGMTVLPFLGGVFGLQKAKAWGGSKSVLGQGIGSLSLGLITWSGGMVIWNYYLFFTQIEVPYPSFADALFVLSWPLWTYGVLKMSKVTGARFGVRSGIGKQLLFIIPVVIAFISYYLLIQVARGGVLDLSGGILKVFFDLFYPLGDVVIFTVTAIVYMLSRKFLGGRYKIPILMLFIGFVLNYLTDFTFSYTTTLETYFNGHFVDFMFTTTMFILSLGINNLDPQLGD